MRPFSLGKLVATPAAIEAIEAAKASLPKLLERHCANDWGDVDREDAAANDAAIEDGSRILSAYVLETGVKIWIITEATNSQGMRESTCVLLPNDY